METEYRILEKSFVNEYGKVVNVYYIIQYKKRFLWMTYWRNVTHQIGGISDVYNTTTEFSSVEQATEFAERHICGGMGYDGWETKVITTNKCN